ncbi:hypothetical protein HDU92_008508 [Lobulomyces angularis]|nr:hypothetical protein HDU92_008508 [Lobulomyces angularis]
MIFCDEARESLGKSTYFKEQNNLIFFFFFLIGALIPILVNKLISIYFPDHINSHCHAPLTEEEQNLLQNNVENDHTVEVYGTFKDNSLDINTPPNYVGAVNYDDVESSATSDMECTNLKKSLDNEKDKNKEFFNVGLTTAISISLHKLPEGFLLFTTTTLYPSNSHLTFILFVALALHNLAEGVAIAVPMYLATKNMWKTFIVTLILGGLSQPLGGLIGYFLVIIGKWSATEQMNDIFGPTFSVVCGMMLWIVFDGMLPIAYESKGVCSKRILTFGLFSGVAIMILVEALITLATEG